DTRWWRLSVPAEELAHDAAGPLGFLLAEPGAAEVEVMPDVVDALFNMGTVSPGGGEHRCGVDEDAEVPDHVRRSRARSGFQQPAQPAPVERLHLRRRQPGQYAVRRGG